jgi:hypothetical protein
MKDTMRELVAAQRQEDFISAAARVERLLPLAEASCDKVDDIICTIGVLASKLAAAPMLSDSLVLPTPLAGFVAEPTTAAR